jgi:hypothetical protein
MIPIEYQYSLGAAVWSIATKQRRILLFTMSLFSNQQFADLRQYRIIQVCGLRSKIFRQGVQIIGVHTDVWMPIFGQSDGIRFKQGVRRELCGVALT